MHVPSGVDLHGMTDAVPDRHAPAGASSGKPRRLTAHTGRARAQAGPLARVQAAPPAHAPACTVRVLAVTARVRTVRTVQSARTVESVRARAGIIESSRAPTPTSPAARAQAELLASRREDWLAAPAHRRRTTTSSRAALAAASRSRAALAAAHADGGRTSGACARAPHVSAGGRAGGRARGGESACARAGARVLARMPGGRRAHAMQAARAYRHEAEDDPVGEWVRECPSPTRRTGPSRR